MIILSIKTQYDYLQDVKEQLFKRALCHSSQK